MSVRNVPIEELVENVRTWNPNRFPNDEFRYVDLSSVDQTDKAITGAASIRGSDAPSRARQLIASGDVLVSTVRPNLNGVAPVTPQFDGATASTGFCVLRPASEKLNSSYLMHWVQSSAFIDSMVRQATGASYPAVSDRIIKSSFIPLPPLPEQRRIAAILDKVDALRRKRKRAIELLDSLTQSIFLEMFGDPVSNPKSITSRPLAEVARFTSGGTPSKQVNDYWSGTIPWVSPKDMKVNQILDAEDHISERAIGETTLKMIEAGSTLIVVRGMILAHTAPIAIARRPVTINQDMKAIRFADSIEQDFGFWCLKAQADHILSKVSSAAHGTKRIDMSEVEELRIMIPERSSQQRFVEAASAVARTFGDMEDFWKNSDDLFASLQSRAFSGRL